MVVSVESGPLSREGCMHGEGRQKHHVPSRTRAITSLTASLSFVSLASSLSPHPPPPTVTSPRWFLYRRPIPRSAARRSSGTGGDGGEKHRDIGRSLDHALHRHLEFGRELNLVLGRNNGGKTEKIMLGPPAEVPDEGPSKKRRGRPANVGHFHDKAGPDQFLRIIFKPTFGRLLIPQAFVKWFEAIPSNIIIRNNTGCSWRMTTRREGNDAFIDQGWAGFAIAHQLKVG
ncbi:hypothetical protein QYE76_016340 [Lolium multiflorum]|uniref:TF-B3 domain-containing protein n=1 Tax=Lolium multiflorum TaxID=4521 RepID=A0AAD8QGK2_LOLMU|nr:hypothetical protein QYE76_016340 [Lolium multiflorum]